MNPKNKKNNNPAQINSDQPRKVSRGEAIRAQRRSHDMAQELADGYEDASSKKIDRVAQILKGDDNDLRITFLGGQDAIGEKNMQVFEWKNDAIIIDCGNELGIDLPGVNYAINDPTYLEQIKHKIKAYVISHGHLDHLGGLRHIVPKYPAPIYGSRYTIGVIEKSFDDATTEIGLDYTPDLKIMNMDNHEKVKIGEFFIELVRITHSVPESSAIVIDTPVGKVINTGDWRLDPEPLDDKPTDVARLKELGDEGVLLLMSDSTGADKPGRTPTEHTLQESFHDVIVGAEGRIFVAIFSSNMNRVQMIINSAVKAGRKVALDGRSMLAYAEIAVRQGLLKIPKGTILSMRELANMPPNKVLVVCTGGQGEPGAALQRMAEGEHKYVNLNPGDTVLISSTPIPGNEIRYQEIANQLASKGVHLYRHPTHQIDGCGPLHVSGHAARDEYREILHIIRPKYFAPIYAGYLWRKYYHDIALEEGIPRNSIIMPANGDSIALGDNGWKNIGQVPHGSLLVDQTANIVSGVVVKDRLTLAKEGLVAVVLTIDKKTGQLMTSPDIISRGFIYMKDEEELMNAFRIELKRAVSQRFKRIDLDRFKAELREHVTHFLYEQTGRSPIVIPVINILSNSKANQGGNGKNSVDRNMSSKNVSRHQNSNPEQEAQDLQAKFARMRQKLLNQDPKVD